MSLIDSLKQRFDREIKVSDIKYDWDSGHCYTHIVHPLMDEVMNMDLTQDQEDEWSEYTNEWMSENQGPEYCVPELINELVGKSVVVSCEHGDLKGEELVDHVVGFIDLVKNHTTETESTCKWYHIEVLEKWVHLQNLNKIVKS